MPLGGVKTGFGRANSSAGRRRCRSVRTRPQTPGEAQKRPRLRASENVERRFHLTTLLEETRVTNRHSPPADEVAEFADQCVWSADGRPGRCPSSSCRSRANRRAGITAYRLAA